MRSDELIDVIGEAPDEYIVDAKSVKKKRIPRWVKWSSVIAACLVAAVGVGGMLFIKGGIAGGSAGGSVNI